MRAIVLHKKSTNESIEVPINLGYEGVENEQCTSIWWYDNQNNKHSETVKESVSQIKEMIENRK